MNRNHYYAEARSAGWRAVAAWDAAIVREAWDAAVADDKVRLRVVPDEYYEPDDDDPKYRRLVAARAKREGAWGIVSEVRCSCCGAWRVVDSCWGFIGDDWSWSGYDVDVMRAALAVASDVLA